MFEIKLLTFDNVLNRKQQMPNMGQMTEQIIHKLYI